MKGTSSLKINKHPNEHLYAYWKPPTLIIEPDENNFIGTDENEPQVCKTFSCKNHLSIEERRFGDICVHCQEKIVWLLEIIYTFDFIRHEP